MAAERLYPRRHSARFWIILTAFLGGGPSIYLIGSGVTLIATRIAAMAFGCFAGFIAANQAPSAFDVVPASQRASAVGVLNLVGSTISGFAPFLGGRARRTIGVGQLMAYRSVVIWPPLAWRCTRSSATSSVIIARRKSGPRLRGYTHRKENFVLVRWNPAMTVAAPNP